MEKNQDIPGLNKLKDSDSNSFYEAAREGDDETRKSQGRTTVGDSSPSPSREEAENEKLLSSLFLAFLCAFCARI